MLAAVTVGNATDVTNAPDLSSISSLVANDGGDGVSLREAITAANNTSGADTISFDASVFTGGAASVIRLGGTQLVISEALTIDGSTGANVLITADSGDDDVTVGSTDITDAANNTNASDNSRVLEFTATTGDLTLRGLTLTGGDVSGIGGAILNNSGATLTIEHSSISGNRASGEAGGILSFTGDVSLTGSTVSGNVSGNAGGGLWLNSGDLVLTNSTVSGNQSALSGGGIRTNPGAVTLVNSTVSGNQSGYVGGGIYTRLGAVTLTSSTVSGNSTTGNDSSGGGIFTKFGAVTLTSSTVSGNSTPGHFARGAGIRTGTGAVALTDSTVSGNHSYSSGAGIFASSGTVTLTSSTVSGNSALGFFARGGGIHTSFGPVTLSNSTVTRNSARRGGGIYLNNSSQSLTLQNSLVAGNTAGGTEPDLFFFSGNPTDFDFSLIGDIGTAPFAEAQTADSNGNLVGSAAGGGVIDPMLTALADHGGPTQTHLPLPGSPAIDAGNTTLTTDQRGLTRPIDIQTIGNASNGADIGAVERGFFQFTSPAIASVGENTQGVHTLTAILEASGQLANFRLLGQAPAGDLGSDQSLEIDHPISSPDGTAELRLQGDGNLVLRDSGTVTWATGTENQGAVRATIQANGNLVLTNSAGGTVYQTNSGSAAGSFARLHVTNEGQLLVLRVDGAKLWESTSNNGSGAGTVLTPAPLATAFTKAADTDLFQISGSNQLEFMAAPDFENPADADGDNVYEVSVLADDGNGGVTPQTIQVTVTDLDEGLVVTTTADAVVTDGMTSLREAIIFADSQPGGDTITFDAALAGSTITLGSELLLTTDITIDGDTNGDEKADITISGNNASRIFTISGTGSDAALRSLTLENGNSAGQGGGGGAISVAAGASLELLSSTVRGSSTSSDGGGIYNAGTLRVANSTISGNRRRLVGRRTLQQRHGVADQHHGAR